MQVQKILSALLYRVFGNLIYDILKSWVAGAGGVVMILFALYLWWTLHWRSILAHFIITLLFLVGVLLIYLSIKLHRYIAVEITSPWEGEEVGYEQVVKGYITLPDIPLQAWIFAGDNLWHLQAPVEVNGHNWSVQCKIGLKDNPRHDNNLTGEHKIMVTLGKKLKGPTRPTLSDVSVKSKPVRVFRKKYDRQ
jgi:hypothetical protein